MKKLIGVFIIISAGALGLYSYSRLSNNQNTPESLPLSTPASIIKPLSGEGAPKNEPLPDLESFKGLEEESTNLFNEVDSLPRDNSSHPLKEAIQ